MFYLTHTCDSDLILDLVGNTVRDFPGIVIADEPKWKDSIQGSNAVVNLAGTPISTRWSPEVVIQTKWIALNLLPTMLILELACFGHHSNFILHIPWNYKLLSKFSVYLLNVTSVITCTCLWILLDYSGWDVASIIAWICWLILLDYSGLCLTWRLSDVVSFLKIGTFLE